jgi:aspartyl-tRNA synthetase
LRFGISIVICALTFVIVNRRVMLRTHTCGELKDKDIGTSVALCGWVGARRDHGNLIFIDLRDGYGLTQVVFDPETDKKIHDMAEGIRPEYVLKVEGLVERRPAGT